MRAAVKVVAVSYVSIVLPGGTTRSDVQPYVREREVRGFKSGGDARYRQHRIFLLVVIKEGRAKADTRLGGCGKVVVDAGE